MISSIAAIVFLFTLYSLSKDDFVLLRKNISLNIVFDIAFLVLLVGLFFSRLVYALTHFSSSFLNPLVFFIIPYFPGITVSGFLIGSLIALYLIVKRRKLPLGKLYDLFALSLLPAAGVFFLGQAAIFVIQKNYIFSLEQLGYSIIFFTAFVLLQTLHIKSVWKDGSFIFISVPLVIVVTALSQLVSLHLRSMPVEVPYYIGLLFLLFASFLVKFFRRASQQ